MALGQALCSIIGGSVLVVRLQGLLQIKQDNGYTTPRDRLKDKDRRKERQTGNEGRRRKH